MSETFIKHEILKVLLTFKKEFKKRVFSSAVTTLIIVLN